MKRVILALTILAFSCSEAPEETTNTESHLSFLYDGTLIELTATEIAPTPIPPGAYQFSVYPGNSNQDGTTSLSFYNPHHLQDAPCFNLMKLSNGAVCGLVAVSGLSDLCGDPSIIFYTSGGQCSIPSEMFDPNNYDQNQVYSIISANVQIAPFGCVTKNEFDPTTGTIVQVSTCNYQGIFSITGRNSFADTLRITQGEFRHINNY